MRTSFITFCQKVCSTELQHLRPNGFTEERTISDFPARNRKLVLHIRRRRWLDEQGKNVILNVCELAVNGTKFSDEFAEFLKKNLDQTPVTTKSLGHSYMIDGSTLEHAYKYTWSDFTKWDQRMHAEGWVLLAQNLGQHLSIDETSLHDDLYTILTNKDGHGRQGTVIAMVRGTKAEDVINVLLQLPLKERQKDRMKLLFKLYPKLKEVYDIVNKLRAIFRSKKLSREEAKTKLHEWYHTVAECTIREIKSARDAIKSREENILSYFIDRSTNASAESFNPKLKVFRAQLRGIRDLPFFIYRICKIFG